MFALEADGFEILEQAIPESWLSGLDSALSPHPHNTRNMLQDPAVRRFAASATLRSVIESKLGARCFATKATLFNKTVESNWKVPWHQDCVIAVKRRTDMAGWGPWSLKSGVTHVRPPADVVSRMMAVRVHLDDCAEVNGALRVLPGSHTGGFIPEAEIVRMNKASQVVCSVRRGDILLMCPLVVHASSCAQNPAARRVVHLEYACEELPQNLEWHDRVEVQ